MSGFRDLFQQEREREQKHWGKTASGAGEVPSSISLRAAWLSADSMTTRPQPHLAAELRLELLAFSSMACSSPGTCRETEAKIGSGSSHRNQGQI